MKFFQHFGLMLTALVLMTILTGCPYSSIVPLDKPNVAVDAKLLGKWIKQGGMADPGQEDYSTFEKKDNFTYIIKEYSYEKEENGYKLSKTYEGYITKIKGMDFFNLKQVGEDAMDPDKFYFEKIVMTSANEIELHEVTDNIKEEFTVSTELKKFFETHCHLSFFYNKDPSTYKKG